MITESNGKIIKTEGLINNINILNIDDLIEGVNVKHEIFGIGTIKKVDNHSNQKKAIVNFKNVGEKTLLLNFAKLKVIK